MPFEFKPFEDMTAEDYTRIGLKVGLEVHQQLLTRRKLFCRCPAGHYTNEYDAIILRHMRPTLSELGEYDGTALMEKKTRKNIYYRIHRDSVCTYEFDDTPPFMIDDEALDIALEISLLLKLNIVGEFHIARKQYLDGSIPTGFQRTGIIGVDGWIPFRDRKVRIRQLSIEEDACREVSDIGHDRVYLTDRLGMPLIETVTEPDMHTPEEAAAVGHVLRLLCLSTGHVRHGYGAARQDVNVSVTGGTRVEIKGTPQIWRNPRLIYNEARRQCALLHIRDLLHERGVTENTLEAHTEDVTRIVAQTTYEPLQAALADGKRVHCALLKGFGALLREPTQEHTTFAKEFSDRIRVIACLTRLPNMVHSDAASESLSGREWKDLRRKMRAQHGDTLILVWGSEADCVTACNEILIRAREATVGIPSDTRQALKDGTNGFERVLPGPDRMYPDTDLPPVPITQTRLDRLEADLPEQVWDRTARYQQLGLSPRILRPLYIARHEHLLDRIINDLKVDAQFAATILVERFRAWRRAGFDIDSLTEDDIFSTFQAHAAGKLTQDGVGRLLKQLAREPRDEPRGDRVAATLAAFNFKPLTQAECTAAIEQQCARLDPARFSDVQKMARHVVGQIKRQYPGRIDGKHLLTQVTTKLQTAAGGRDQIEAQA